MKQIHCGKGRQSLLSVTILGILILFGVGPLSWGKDLNQRLGIGTQSHQLGQSALIQYHPSRNFTWAGQLGFDSGNTASYSFFAASLRRNLIYEYHLNAFLGMKLSYQNFKNVTADSGFSLAATAGVEFFLQELENLGWVIELGVELLTLGNNTQIRTIGGLQQLGIVFYF
ncbi:MAG: hypothetical protein NZ480_00555 [Bdellovibrionaceae bacterium]|nr:hypothetical protein [Pseudobdellovibrionaceae bacterium]MDW8190429.1 hypothetical protein [Pseudobdellovibrionaceae bacterium]